MAENTHGCLGEDPWMGFDGRHIFPRNMVEDLREKGFFYSAQVTSPVRTSIFSQDWYEVEKLGFVGEEYNMGKLLLKFK